MKIKLTAALRAPITNRAEAEAFMRELVRLNLDYHFDDGAVECLYENGHVTKKSANIIEAQVGCCYAAWDTSGVDMKYDCPIGYMLDYGKYEEIIAEALEMMAFCEELEPTSALKQAASNHEINEGPRMGSFVSWALLLPAFAGN